MREHAALRIPAFVVLTFGWAWAWWGLSIVLLHRDPTSPIATIATFLGTCAPAIAAWTMWRRTSGARAAWRELGRRATPSGPWTAWLLPSLTVLGVLAFAAWVQHRWGAPVPDAPPLWLILPQLLVMLVAGGGQEEVGWRGWLHPAVRERTGRWRAPLIVAAIWFCWHLPLWWLPGAVQTFVPMPAFAMMLLGLSLLLARTLEATGGRAAVAIWLHALNNLAAGWLVFLAPEQGVAQPGSWAMGGAYLVAGTTAMLIRRPAVRRRAD